MSKRGVILRTKSQTTSMAVAAAAAAAAAYHHLFVLKCLKTNYK